MEISFEVVSTEKESRISSKLKLDTFMRFSKGFSNGLVGIQNQRRE